MALKNAIEAECHGASVVATSDEGTTGNFEVSVNGTLVHSKATKGHDKCETATTTQLVIDAVTEAIDAQP